MDLTLRQAQGGFSGGDVPRANEVPIFRGKEKEMKAYGEYRTRRLVSRWREDGQRRDAVERRVDRFERIVE